LGDAAPLVTVRKRRPLKLESVTMAMNSELKAKWIAKLRSGDIEQAQGTLQSKCGGMCCLGVLMAVQDTTPVSYYGVDFDYGEDHSDLETSCIPEELSQGLPFTEQDKLASMNDGTGEENKAYSFVQIADYLENDPNI
jgi:hypothetical protein